MENLTQGLTLETLPKAFTYLANEVSEIKRLILEKSKEPQPQPETDQLLTIQHVAEMLSLSVPTIYNLVSRSEIPCMKKGKRLYFLKDEITNWIKTGRKKTLAEIDSEADAYLLTQKKRG